MIHQTFASFWKCYDELPESIRELADKNYELLQANSFHPSLHFKRLGRTQKFWSVRVGDGYRALAIERGENVFAWFWIGTHADYNRLIKK